MDTNKQEAMKRLDVALTFAIIDARRGGLSDEEIKAVRDTFAKNFDAEGFDSKAIAASFCQGANYDHRAGCETR